MGHGLLLLLLALLLVAGPVTGQSDPSAELYELINQARRNEGLPPLASAHLLAQAAQRHAEDIAARGTATHEGSDGSTPVQRIREAGYRAWNDGLLVDEVFWLGLGTPLDALTWLHKDPENWAPFADPRYREIGVGYGVDEQGVHYFVITLGSRPGVLPIFINDGAAVTDSPQVAVRLTNEEAEPLGEGAWMGRAIEVRLSNTPDFEGVPWQPWEALLPWALESAEPGDYAVYAEFRDGAERTAVSEATIRLVAPGEAPPTPTPLPLLPDAPASAATPSGGATPATPEATPEAPATAAPTASPTPAGIEMTAFPTWTPLPDEEVLAPAEERSRDWPLLLAFALQALALFLGFLAFLRRR